MTVGPGGYTFTPMTTNKVPGPVARCCYACDATAAGWRDRTPEGGIREAACERHADPTIRVFVPCRYCGTPTRKGSIYLDTGEYAHGACHKEAVRS